MQFLPIVWFRRFVAKSFATAVFFLHFAVAVTFGAELSFTELDSGDQSDRIIMFEGEIKSGDFQKLKQMSSGHIVLRIGFRSPGGDVFEAVRIAEFMNDRLIQADAPLASQFSNGHINPKKITKRCEVPGAPDLLPQHENCLCNTACALIWLSSPMRLGNYIGIHRPRFESSFFAGLEPHEAEQRYATLLKSVSDFMRNHDVSEKLLGKMNQVSSGDVYVLNQDEIDEVGFSRPFVDEMMLARCTEFHADYMKGQKLRSQLDEGMLSDSTAEYQVKIDAFADYVRTSPFEECYRQNLSQLRAERLQ